LGIRVVFLVALAAVTGGVAAPRVRAREQAPPPPRQGATVNIEPTSGRTFYRKPGQTKRARLTAEIQVPVNTIIDASNGQMGITSANGVADFRGGAFVVREPRKQRVTQLFLAGGNLNDCPPGSTRAVRQLWGSGKGRFQTRGRYAAATVRGTTWRVQDRCDGTLTTVIEGVVAVRDFRLGRTVLVRAGQSYLARR
jgi:hypothetical protein